MINIVVLQDTLNPISAQERVKINENWDALRRGFSSLQNQINFLSGGTEVDEIVARIEQTIQDAQTNTQNAIDSVNDNYAEKLVEINQSLEDLATALTNTQTATSEANTARDNAISATNDAQSAIANVLAIINDLRAVGEWNITTNYKRNNLVSFDGQTYIALVDNVNTPLTNTSTWSLFAAKGSKGDKGDIGETGAALSIQGRLNDQSELPATGEAGQAYTINGELWVWSENVMQWENVGNIKGEKGDTGDVGPQGPPGETPDLTPYITQLNDHEARITTLENGEVTVKADVSGLNREVAYLKLRQEAGDRIEGGTVFADDFNGSRFGFELKAAKVTSNVPLNQGETILTGKVNDVRDGNFTVGTEVEVLDNNNSEKVTIVRSETVDGVYNLEISALVNSYGTGAIIGESTIEIDGSISSFTMGDVINNASIVQQQASTVYTETSRKSITLNNGNIYVAYINASGGWTIEKSVDKGKTFTEFVSKTLNTVDLALCTDGNIVMLAFSRGTTIIYFAYNDDGTIVSGVSAANGNRIASNLFSANKVDMYYDATTGNIHVAYLYKVTEASPSTVLYHSISTNNGGAWSAPIAVTNYNSSEVALSVSLNNINNTIRAFYVEVIGANYNLVMASLSGTTWTRSIFYSANTPLSNVQTVAHNSNLVMTWRKVDSSSDVVNGILCAVTPSNSEVNFTTPVTILEGGLHSTAAYSNGKFVLAAVNGNNVNIYSTENPLVIGNPIYTLVGNQPYLSSGFQSSKEGFSLFYKTENALNFQYYENDSVVYQQNKGVANYVIPSTDYVGVFVKKAGNLTIQAYLNEQLMTSELIGDEYTFEGQLSVASPATLRLELNRTDTSNGNGDRLTRILGGRS